MKTSAEPQRPAVAMEGKRPRATGAALDRGWSQRAGNGPQVSHFERQAPPGPTAGSEASWKQKWTAAQSHGLQDKCRGAGAGQQAPSPAARFSRSVMIWASMPSVGGTFDRSLPARSLLYLLSYIWDNTNDLNSVLYLHVCCGAVIPCRMFQ